MRIRETYSHLNGEEFLLVHHRRIYAEIKHAVAQVDAGACRTKLSKERTMRGKPLFSPKALNHAFAQRLRRSGWREHKYQYYVSTDRKVVELIAPLPLSEQRAELRRRGVANPLRSEKQTDFVKDGIAVEIQFGKYAFVAYDLFVKHLLFYSGGLINVGVEILPTKAMLTDPHGGRRMSTGIAYFEGEVYNVLRHGRNSPPVPLVIIGIEP